MSDRPPKLNESGKRESAYGQPRARLLAWGQESNAHGLMYHDIIMLPVGDKPEMDEWIRLPWMDEPEDVSYLQVTSCMNCPFVDAHEGSAVSCAHEGSKPHNTPVERSWESGKPPPRECPLRSAPTLIELAVKK